MKCPICGSQTTQELRTHHYKESGLTNVFIRNVSVEVCSCGEEYIQIPGMDEVDRKIGESLLAKEQLLTGEEIRFLRKWLELTSDQFAVACGVKRATVSRWENGKIPVHKLIDRFVRLYVSGMKGIAESTPQHFLFPSTQVSSATSSRIEIELSTPADPPSFLFTATDTPAAPSCYKAVNKARSRRINEEDWSPSQVGNQPLAEAA